MPLRGSRTRPLLVTHQTFSFRLLSRDIRAWGRRVSSFTLAPLQTNKSLEVVWSPRQRPNLPKPRALAGRSCTDPPFPARVDSDR